METAKIFLVFLVVCVANLQALPRERGSNKLFCMSGWLPFDGHCYLYVKTKTPWDNAKSECKKYSSKLVEIETEAENTWLKEKILPKKADCPSLSDCAVWIGATDRDVEGTYVWDSDKRPVTFSPWYPGEPNNMRDQDCIDLLISGNWNDEHCVKSLGFICEMDQLNSYPLNVKHGKKISKFQFMVY